MLDPTTKLLFSPFQREVATPVRRHIKSQAEFEQFISTNNGRTDCYCDLYPYPFDGMIDKIYYDLDGVHKGMEESLPFAQRFYESLINKDLTVIPIASGVKGFNIYPILKPKRYKNAKELLTKVAYSLVVDEFGEVSPTTVITNGVEHPTLMNDEGVICIDPKVIGDVRRFSRIPNTLRPPKNKAWCTYLPPDDFLDMNIKDIYNHIKTPHTYNYKLNKNLPTLNFFPISEEVKKMVVRPTVRNNIVIKLGDGNEYLRRIIRPSLYKHILQAEPRHTVRVAVAVDLLEFLSPDEVFEIFLKLNWSDWDPELTKYQIRSCIRLKRYSNKRLRQLGVV